MPAHRRHRLLVLAAVAAGGMSGASGHALAADACGPGLRARAEAVLEPYTGRVPAASLLVLKEGRVLLGESRGFADLEAGRPAASDTHYRLASVSKQFTAMAVLLLVQDGVLSLEDPIGKWLPSLPPAPGGATLRQVLSHRGGLVDYEDFVSDDAPRQVRDADVLALLEGQDRTLFAPGAGYRYSNSGYALLALVVERASGQAYPDFLQARIFAPLGMASLARVDAGPAVPERAYGYRLEDGAWVRRDQSSTSAVLGDGGIYASVDELARWDAALYDDRLLGDALRAQMFARQGGTDDPEVDYGLGWRLTGDTAWHSGESIGFRNVIIRDASRRTTVILLTNRDDPEPYAQARGLLACTQDRWTTR
jgi:CubicO group peptidase (beta-lactamase class C family)